VNGLVLDTSALLAYASGASVEPGAMLALADEDPNQQGWIPALCLGQAQLELTGSPRAAMLDVLMTPDRDIQVAGYDAATSRRVARIAATYTVPLDVAHAVATAVLYRCYLVTRDPKTAAAAGPAGLEVLDISETWE
jgi:opacity protein-like surface antigen